MNIFQWFNRKKPFTTLGGKEMLKPQDIWDFVEDLSSRIERSGDSTAAKKIRTGVGYINGLTDGWALFLESLEQCVPSPGSKFGAQESSDLQELTEYVRKVVYR